MNRNQDVYFVIKASVFFIDYSILKMAQDVNEVVEKK